VKTWIVFDSVHGNTEQVARSIGESIAGEVTVSAVTEAGAAEAGKVDLLIVGSPTLRGRPTEAVQTFLSAIYPSSLKHVRVAAFDTRVSMKFARIFGYAADRIGASLTSSGGIEAARPEGFIVRGRKGPLADNELKRAADWARSIVGSRS
jgi:flavodoxin